MNPSLTRSHPVRRRFRRSHVHPRRDVFRPALHLLSAADIRHREDFRQYVEAQADPAYRPWLHRLYDCFDHWNEAFFEARLTPPYLMLDTPSNPRVLATYSPVSGFGGYAQIRIRKRLLTGEHSLVQEGEGFAEGRFLVVADVLLHELVHQWHDEITGRPEKNYSGHGPAFRDKCNEIGAQLGLPPVRAAKARGKDQALPSCSYWPHSVRPPEFYLGAYLESFSEGATEAEEPFRKGWESLRASRAAEQEAALAALVSAAQTFAVTWPGSAQEAAECYLDTTADDNCSLPQLQTLFEAASTFGPFSVEGTRLARVGDPRWGIQP